MKRRVCHYPIVSSVESFSLRLFFYHSGKEDSNLICSSYDEDVLSCPFLFFQSPFSGKQGKKLGIRQRNHHSSCTHFWRGLFQWKGRRDSLSVLHETALHTSYALFFLHALQENRTPEEKLRLCRYHLVSEQVNLSRDRSRTRDRFCRMKLQCISFRCLQPHMQHIHCHREEMNSHKSLPLLWKE